MTLGRVPPKDRQAGRCLLSCLGCWGPWEPLSEGSHVPRMEGQVTRALSPFPRKQHSLAGDCSTAKTQHNEGT